MADPTPLNKQTAASGDNETIISHCRVTMRDGIDLAVRVVRPRAEGRYPVVMACSPYRLLPQLGAASREEFYTNNLNGPDFLASNGFACINYDVRGTGSSGGVTTEIYSQEERQDGHDMVEWAAAQAWSNGNVGMWGKSFGAVATLQIAAMSPPSLKAIIVCSGTDALFRDWAYPGGSPRTLFNFGTYAANMAAYNFAPPDPSHAPEDWAELWLEKRNGSIPWSLRWLDHQTDDQFWRSASVAPDYGKIKCAVFMIEGWADWYQTAFLRLYEKLDVPRRILVGPWAHYWPEDGLPGPRRDCRQDYIRWFDQFLNDKDTGILEEPPLTIFVGRHQAPRVGIVERIGQFRFETEWPPERSRPTTFTLEPNGGLRIASEGRLPKCAVKFDYRPSASVASGILGQGSVGPWGLPGDQRTDDAFSAIFTSEPLSDDLEVIGNLTARLFVSSTASRAYFHVRFCDVAPDGSSYLVSCGGKNGTHWKSSEFPELLKPGQVYALGIELKSAAHVFGKGHRIRIAISGSDFQNTWPTGEEATHSIWLGGDCQSQICLPVAPSRGPELPLPPEACSPVPLPTSLPTDGLEHKIVHDLVAQTTTVCVRSELLGKGDVSFTVSDADPGTAKMISRAEYRPESSDDITIRATASTFSDREAIRHAVHVEALCGGAPTWSKSWTKSVSRQWF